MRYVREVYQENLFIPQDPEHCPARIHRLPSLRTEQQALPLT